MSRPLIRGHIGKRLDDKDLLIKYLEKSTVQIDGCWIFTGGSKTKDGYRRIVVDKKVIGVHRLSAYIFLRLDLNDSDQYANHKPECSSKCCWNPQHIYVGDLKQNQKDRRTEYCIRGHKKSYYKDSSRTYCKLCNNLSSRKSRMKSV